MKKIHIVLAVFALVMTSVIAVNASVVIYGDKTCYDDWLVPGVVPLWICYNPDGGMDHSFLTYEAMSNYYNPPLPETVIAPEIIVYGDVTESYSGR